MTGRELASILRRGPWKELARARAEPVTEGMSGAALYRIFEEGQPVRYLKIARSDAVAGVEREITRTRWLAAQGLRVPAILRVERQPGQTVMLTRAVPGLPADQNPLPVERLIDSLATTLAALHALDPAHCPFDETLEIRLARAADAVASGGIDTAQFEPRNRATLPESLLRRLVAEQPAEDLVVVHGDATLSNLVVDAEGTIGFVDCGNAGRGDRYLDLAVLAQEIGECYGSESSVRFARAYSPSGWDTEKARFFTDLYEFF